MCARVLTFSAEAFQHMVVALPECHSATSITLCEAVQRVKAGTVVLEKLASSCSAGRVRVTERGSLVDSVRFTPFRLCYRLIHLQDDI